MIDLSKALGECDKDSSAEELQKIIYSVGIRNNFEPMKNWFRAIYEVLLGEQQGPRFGGFVALYGVEKTVELIQKALAGSLVK